MKELMSMGFLGIMAVVANLFMLSILNIPLNNKGEAGDGKNDDKGGDGGIKFTEDQQKFIDKVIDKKYKSWKEEEKTRFSEYEDLKKFKDDHIRAQDAKAQEELEKAKKYDEAKKGYETKVTELTTVVSKKDQEINDLRINHALTNE